jgi:hypothetical protein
VTAILALLFGCSVVATPNDDDIRCVLTERGADPCREIGRWCVGGRCLPQRPDGGQLGDGGCTPSSETCNGLDDDCDGAIDNGHDVDADGVTWCGGGIMMYADCDDSSPSVHPGVGKVLPGEEVCDGRDNDCNGTTDDGASCGSGFVCELGQCRDPLDCRGRPLCQAEEECVDEGGGVFRCVMRSECSMTVPCTPPRECDLGMGVCFLPPQPLGGECTGNADCMSRVCAPGPALGLGPALSLCSQACCNDMDCPEDFLCWPSGTGAKMCVPASRLGRTWGPGVVGDTCSPSMTTECRSGVCYASNTCAANCTSDRDCGSPRACVFNTVRGELAGMCETPPGTAEYPDGCDVDADCRSGLCLFAFVGPIPVSFCARGCRADADCMFGDFCTAVEIGDGAPLPICVPFDPSDPPVCCNDDSCTSGRCRPVPMGSMFSMRCTAD